MAFAPLPETKYFKLSEVYESVHLNRRLAGIAKTLGKKEGQALSVTPRIRWEPKGDRYKPAEMQGEPAVLPGPGGANRNVIIEEFDRRDAGATIWLFADTYSELEDLVIKFRGALSDVLRADRMYSAPDGEPIPPESDGVSTWAYRMPLTVRLLCADVYQATSPQDDQGEMGSTS